MLPMCLPLCVSSPLDLESNLALLQNTFPFHYRVPPNLLLSIWLQPLSRGMCLCPTKSMPFSLLCTYQDIKKLS
jgi:hypothetical protein